MNSVGWLSTLFVIAVGHLTPIAQCGKASDGLVNELERSPNSRPLHGAHFLMIRRTAWSGIECGFLYASGQNATRSSQARRGDSHRAEPSLLTCGSMPRRNWPPASAVVFTVLVLFVVVADTGALRST